MKTVEQIKKEIEVLLNELRYAVSFEQVKFLQGKIASLEWCLDRKRSFEE
jgi:hypothetical protein